MLNSVKSILYSGYIKKKSIFLGNTYGSIHLGVKCHDACNLFSNAWHVCVCKAGREGERERRKERIEPKIMAKVLGPRNWEEDV